MRSANSTSADQPVANAIGISGSAAWRTRRRTISSTRNTATSPSSRLIARREVDDSSWLASAASTGSPTTSAVTPAGGSSLRLMSSITFFWRSSGISRMPNARLATLWSGASTPCEK
jgi:hypothetical protein